MFFREPQPHGWRAGKTVLNQQEETMQKEVCRLLVAVVGITAMAAFLTSCSPQGKESGGETTTKEHGGTAGTKEHAGQ